MSMNTVFREYSLVLVTASFTIQLTEYHSYTILIGTHNTNEYHEYKSVVSHTVCVSPLRYLSTLSPSL